MFPTIQMVGSNSKNGPAALAAVRFKGRINPPLQWVAYFFKVNKGGWTDIPLALGSLGCCPFKGNGPEGKGI